ncbi:MAG: hypothetical protein WD988_01680 [Candidatus Curtissbacteria bacterium]
MLGSSVKPKTAVRAILDPFETLTENFAPVASEFSKQMFGDLLGSGRPQSIGGAELARARKEKELQEKEHKDNEDSQKQIQEVRAIYSQRTSTVNSEQSQIKEEMVQLQNEVVRLAKTAGIETSVHLENVPKKVGVIDIKRLTAIVKTLRLKAEDARAGSELVSQRSNAKRPTGMMAWVSGKQMKIHEQGTMQLQG